MENNLLVFCYDFVPLNDRKQNRSTSIKVKYNKKIFVKKDDGDFKK